MVCFWPYLISADFKPGTAKTLLATFGLIVGNVTLILIYTTILHKVFISIKKIPFIGIFLIASSSSSYFFKMLEPLGDPS